MNLLVIGADPQKYIVEVEQFRRAALFWEPHGTLQNDSDFEDVTDVSILVERPGESAFHIMHSRSGHSVFTDGTPAQAAEVAAWIIESFPPDPGVEVWLTDDAYTEHVSLTPGITPEQITAGWQPNPQ